MKGHHVSRQNDTSIIPHNPSYTYRNVSIPFSRCTVRLLFSNQVQTNTIVRRLCGAPVCELWMNLFCTNNTVCGAARTQHGSLNRTAATARRDNSEITPFGITRRSVVIQPPTGRAATHSSATRRRCPSPDARAVPSVASMRLDYACK